MRLQKKILDDEKKLFAEPEEGGLSAILGSSQTALSAIEKRKRELDEKLFELASKHRTNYSKANLTATGYRMPDAYEEDTEKTGY